jgi:hypothetical protein
VNWKKPWIGSALLIIVIVVSCTKISSTEIGEDLIPAVDNINTFDTVLEVTTENFLFTDSAFPRITRTTVGGAPELLAGYISNDPQFGTTNASMYFFLSPPAFPAPYKVMDSLYLDSIVLCVRWNGNIIGDTVQNQTFNVFRLREQLRPDSAYKTSDVFAVSELLGSRTFRPESLKDSLFVLEQKLNRQLRIRLSDDFGNEVLKWDTAAGKPLGSDSVFRRTLPGFALQPDLAGAPGANALMGFLISDTNTYVRLYYRYDSLGVRDTTFSTFKYVINGGFANNITRNYNGSLAGQAARPGQDSIVYIQTSPGTYATVRIPGIEGFKAAKGNVIINRAELVMQQVPSTGQFNDIFPPPDLLYVDYFDSLAGLQRPFLDDGFSVGTYTPAFLGGIRKYVPGPGGTPVAEYRFTLSRYVQGMVTKNNYNNRIYLYSPYYIRYVNPIIFQTVNSMAKGRVKLGGGSNKQQKMYVRIIYSKL